MDGRESNQIIHLWELAVWLNMNFILIVDIISYFINFSQITGGKPHIDYHPRKGVLQEQFFRKIYRKTPVPESFLILSSSYGKLISNVLYKLMFYETSTMLLEPIIELITGMFVWKSKFLLRRCRYYFLCVFWKRPVLLMPFSGH